MKQLINLWLFIVIALLWGCGDDDNIPVVFPEKKGTVTDNRGNEYEWVRYGGLDWLASNFRSGEPFYNVRVNKKKIEQQTKAKESYKLYGNMFTYEQAMTYADSLGTPGEWRLPTDEEWQQLEKALGMSAKTAAIRGWRGAPVGELLQQDSTGTNFNLALSGYVTVDRSGSVSWSFNRLREYGYWWTATKVQDSPYKDGTVVYCRYICSGTAEICREQVTVEDMYYTDDFRPKFMSVRYVRDARN